MSLNENKAGGAAVDPDDYNAVVDAVVVLQAGGGGGSQPGAAVVRYFPFAFDTAGLANGVPIWTPATGDLLLDAWFDVTTEWDGTTPSADISQYTGAASPWGLWGNISFPPRLDRVPSDIDGGGGPANTLVGTGVFIPLTLASAAESLANASTSSLAAYAGGAKGWIGRRPAPARFTSTDPLLLVVSQDGSKGGDAIGSLVGAATIYIVTCTPTLATP